MGISIVMVGSGGVGKSALTLRFVRSEFNDHYNPTIDSSFTKLVQVSSETTVNVDIHDTAGQEVFSSLRAKYYPEADGFVLCYSITDDETFAALKELHEEILDLHSNPNVPLCLVGTKWDLADTERVVSVKEGRSFAEAINAVEFYETSAKLNKSVSDIFVKMSQSIAVSQAHAANNTGSVFGAEVVQKRAQQDVDSSNVTKNATPDACCTIT